jgi:hypothetical protein
MKYIITHLICFGVIDFMFGYVMAFLALRVGIQHLLFMSSLESLLGVFAKGSSVLSGNFMICLIVGFIVEAFRFFFFVFTAGRLESFANMTLFMTLCFFKLFFIGAY